MTTPPNPKLTPSSTTATNTKVQATQNRLGNAIDNLASPNSPITVYLPTAVGGVGATPGTAGNTTTNPGGSGTWTCPTGITSVQVEAVGAGGGGGGGTTGAQKPVTIASNYNLTMPASGNASVPVTTSATAGSTTSGGAILVAVSIPDAGSSMLPVITDTQNNVYSFVYEYFNPSSASTAVYACFGNNALTAGQDSFIINPEGAIGDASFVAVFVPDITGYDNNSSPEFNNGTSTTTSVTAPAIATDSVFVFVFTYGTGSNSVPGTASGWTKFSTSNGANTASYQIDGYYSQAPSTEILSFSATYGASQSWAANSVSFLCVSANAQGGGGGGGGEYACEPAYPVVPGQEYAYTIGFGGQGGVTGTSGEPGGSTTFDAAGVGLVGGVVGNGGLGGDATSVGQGGSGGSGSGNTTHMSGGNGGSTASGVNSDNPANLTSVNPPYNWFIFDQYNGSTGNGNGYFTDSGPNGYNMASQTIGSGATCQVQNTVMGPPQVFTGNSGSGYHVFPGGCLYLKPNSKGQTAALEASPSMVIRGKTALTLSCWVRGNGSAQFGGSSGSTARIMGDSGNGTTGTAINITSTGVVQFFVSNSGGSTTISSAAGAVSSTSGKWYQIVATFSSGSMALYINGTSVATGTTSGSSTGASTNNFYIASRADVALDNCFQGYLSNVWVSLHTMSSSDAALAYGIAAATAGSGGGSAGGSSSSGNNGTGASTSTGAAGGAVVNASNIGVNSGGGAGGNGGNAGSSGVVGTAPPSGAPFGPTSGGGGGAGTSATPVTVSSLQLLVQASGSYCGSDASGGNAGALYTSSAQTPSTNANGNTTDTSIAASGPTVYQGGYNSGNGPTLGTMNSLLILPSGIAGQLAGKTIQKVTLTVTPETTSPVTLMLGYSADTTLPGNWTGSDINPLASLQTSGSTATYDITATGIGTALKSGAATALTLGPGTTPGAAAYNSSSASTYYGTFDGADDIADGGMYLTVYYTTGTAISGGNGASGYIAITYVNPNGIPVAGITAEATKDAAGNKFAASLTGTVTAFDPTIATPGSYVPESWKPATFTTGSLAGNAGWINSASSTVLQYKKMPDNTVRIIGQIKNAGAAISGQCQVFTLPSQYWPATQPQYLMSNTTAEPDAVYLFEVTTSGIVQFYSLPGGGAVPVNTAFNINVSFPIDA